MHGMKSVKIF